MKMHLVAVLFVLNVVVMGSPIALALDCTVGLLTTGARELPSQFHSSLDHPENEFFRFTITEQKDEIYQHQNYCITGRTIGDKKLKGQLCLLVSSGFRQVYELGTVPSTDSYLSEDGKVVTFEVFHSIRDRHQNAYPNRRFLINAASEVSWPISSYRTSFQGDGGGLGALTVTCK